MKGIKISALCITFGRVEHLQKAIRCFLDQDYGGEKELVVVNTFPDQKLSCDFKDVRIINLSERPPSLGACRNIAVENATGDLLVTWDDDDLYLPIHLSNFAENFDSGSDWIWMENQFYSEKGRILKLMHGSYNTFAFTKSAWKSSSGYRELSVGEDKTFVSRVTSELKGKKVSLPEEKISFIYCWGNGIYHISGLGVDRGGLQTAYSRSADDLRRRTKNGLEKTGNIALKLPEKSDPTLLVKDFVERTSKKLSNLPVCIVELGRYGDIINCLPVCKHIYENYGKPHLMVAREFAPLLDGVSYVTAEAVDIAYDLLPAALEMACRKFPIVLRGQIWGKGHTQEKQCESYNKESWRELGFLKDFSNPDFNLVFDQRDHRREQQLVQKLKTDKPMLLVQVTASASSPFESGKQLLQLIRDNFGNEFNIVDLDAVRCERIYDLLVLMDEAVGMVAIDTSVIHLAAASELPVVALVNPMPWAGSIPRCNCVLRIDYNQASENFELLLEKINKSLDLSKYQSHNKAA